MKLTQTFNSRLQFGLLEGLISKSGARNVKVSYLKEVATGVDFLEIVKTNVKTLHLIFFIGLFFFQKYQLISYPNLFNLSD